MLHLGVTNNTFYLFLIHYLSILISFLRHYADCLVFLTLTKVESLFEFARTRSVTITYV
jgi:hypothetical protein